jgi:hypothetical protein
MSTKEKARANGPIPNAVNHDATESIASTEFAQATAKSVFGRDYIVVRAPVPKRNPRITGPKPSRIRAWRAP